jgi:hypothetical protein
MKIESIPISDIKDDDRYLLSYPLDNTRCEALLRTFPFINFIIVDQENRVIFGFEFIDYFKRQNTGKVEIVRVDNTAEEALIFAYNYKDKFFGFNTYEKLIFIQKIFKFVSISELYKKIKIDISVNDELKKNLDLLISSEFKDFLISDSINLKEMDGLKITMFGFLFTGPFAGFHLLFTKFPDPAADGRVFINLGYIIILALFSSVIALILFNNLIKHTPLLFSVSVTYLIPIFAILWGLIDGESINVLQLLWMIVILLGVFLVNKSEEKRLK